MEFRDVVRRRRMIRRYSSAPVDPAAVDRMLEHAQRAPNAGFSQGWAFLVLDTPTDVDLFWWATGARSTGAHARPNAWLEGMRTAPVVIVPLASKDAYLDRYAEPDKGWTDRSEDRWPVPYWYVDDLRAAFSIPADHTPVGAITVGHRVEDTGSKGSAARRERRTNVVHRGQWGTTVSP